VKYVVDDSVFGVLSPPIFAHPCREVQTDHLIIFLFTFPPVL